MLSERHNWTPEQIDAMDPDFIAEKFIYISALQKVEEDERKKAEREAKHASHRR